ncbi:hypothetical protein ACFE04_015900 [Oxalis oulophora]
MDVATPTKDCLELGNDLLVPILKAKNERNLTRQESAPSALAPAVQVFTLLHDMLSPNQKMLTNYLQMLFKLCGITLLEEIAKRTDYGLKKLLDSHRGTALFFEKIIETKFLKETSLFLEADAASTWVILSRNLRGSKDRAGGLLRST